MKHTRLITLVAVLLALVAGAVAAPTRAGGPVTKQNGSSPAFAAFTSICAVSGYAHFGFCGGDITRFTEITGKMNAVQPKAGRYNLDFKFQNLTPGVEYRLWATRDGATWTEAGRAFGDLSGSVKYSYTTDAPGGLGFDLNTVEGNVTLVTSWWSGQRLVVNADGTLSAAGS